MDPHRSSTAQATVWPGTILSGPGDLDLIKLCVNKLSAKLEFEELDLACISVLLDDFGLTSLILSKKYIPYHPEIPQAPPFPPSLGVFNLSPPYQAPSLLCFPPFPAGVGLCPAGFHQFSMGGIPVARIFMNRGWGWVLASVADWGVDPHSCFAALLS